MVDWDQCQDFCRKLSIQAEFQLTLPTETQWEYACRAGTSGAYAGPLDQMAWYRNNSQRKSHPVGTKAPNAWGLHDMHGNVWEWCSNLYEKDGTTRTNRGGGWTGNTCSCRSAAKGKMEPTFKSPRLGLRVVFVPEKE